MLARREFLGALAVPLAAAAGTLNLGCSAPGVLPSFATDPRSPEEIAGDEDAWAAVTAAFPVDRSVVNLNHATVGACPSVVQDAVVRFLAAANEAPPHSLKHVLAPQVEPLRERVAAAWGVSPEEIAFTRNASEGLQIVQLGLDLQPGDEVLTTDQDYRRMIETFRQRERREGVALRLISLPVPCTDDAEVVGRLEQAIGPRTKLLLICHVLSLTGQVLPVKAIVAMARRHGVPVLVDGAQAFAHLDFQLADLECDFYATSLHKWLSAPHGTGLLYIRRERIPEIWPLQPAPAGRTGDIRKFEEIGTHSFAATLAVGVALTFHEAIGGSRKAARLVALRDRCVDPLIACDRVRLLTDRAPGRAGAIATIQVEGLDPRSLRQGLWNEHRMLVRAVRHQDFEGLRVSPSVCTTPKEVDRFVEAMLGLVA